MASPVDTTVKTFSSTMPAAPVLSGTAGALITLLDACLVTGFDLKTATSLVVASGVATLSFSGTHSAGVDSVIFIENASNGLLNGEQRVTSTAAGVLRFATTAADGTATGAITFKMAPAGWAKAFTGTNMAVYRSSDVAGTRMFLQVDDTGTNNARVRAYENMSDINTGQGVTPLQTQVAGGLWWSKSASADTAARSWWVIADARAFYFAVAPANNISYTVFSAGDYNSRKSGDSYGFAISGNQEDLSNTGLIPKGCVGHSNKTESSLYIVRSHTYLGGSVAAAKIGNGHLASSAEAYSGSANYSFGAFPNAAGNELLTCTVNLYAGCYRGEFAGLLHAVQDMAGAVSTGFVFSGQGVFSNKKLLTVRVAPPQVVVATGTVLFDITGPWRL